MSVSSSTDLRRRLLERLPQEQRSHLMNIILDKIRGGTTDPTLIVARVSAAVNTARARAIVGGLVDSAKWSTCPPTIIREHSDEALDLAEWCVWWEQLPSSERERLKAERSSEYRTDWMRHEAATQKQIDYLKSLGVSEADLPTDKGTASQMIDQQLRARR